VRLFGWWYVCLGLAFAALAWRNILYGAPALGIVLRCVIAAGFAMLGVNTLRSARKTPTALSPLRRFALTLLLSSLRGLLPALLQRVENVHDGSLFGLRHGRNFLAFALLLDELLDILAILIVKLLGLERASERIDQALGEVHLLRAVLRL